MSALERLIDEQNKLWKRMCDIRDAAEREGRDLTAEERANWDEAEKRLTEVSGDIERLERMARLEKVDWSQVVVTGGGGDDVAADRRAAYEEAFGLWLRGGMERLNPEQRQMLAAAYEEVRAQGTSPDTAGGYLVPEGFRNVMTETLKAFGGIMNVANVITTSTGNPLVWPTNDDTGNVGAILGENTQVTEQDVTFGQNTLGAHTYTSNLVRVSLQLLQDSAFDLESWLPRKLGERIGRAAAQHFATGSGTGQPQGITQGTVGVTGATSAQPVITYDDLVDLEHSVNSAYRSRARYVLSDAALKLIRKLKDSQDRPLWVPVPAPGFPATINGYPYTVDDGMPAPAPDAVSIAFGDFQAGYVIRQVQGVQVMRLSERYADYLQVGFLGFSRLDGRIDDASAFRLFKHGPASSS